MKMTPIIQCSSKPVNGVLKGLLLPKKRENGMTPERPSWVIILPCEKITDITLPQADKATKTAAALLALEPNA